MKIPIQGDEGVCVKTEEDGIYVSREIIECIPFVREEKRKRKGSGGRGGG